MNTWNQFVEAKTTKVDAVMDIAKNIRDAVKEYTLSTRKAAWKKITSKRGEELVQGILKTPSKSLSPFRTLVP
jgi:uncharacterized protein YoxC